MTIEERRRPIPTKPRRQFHGGSVDSETPSSNLWVGNLPTDITESDLADLFGKHGLLDEITCYASRTYAFLYFKRIEDAIEAKESLQGFMIAGNRIKIEFAKPAKPSKQVWVGGFGSSVTKEMLEEELSKLGNIDDFKFIRDRNIALVDFVKLEDASLAVKSLNGLQIGGDRIRVDFLRSHQGRREQSDFSEMRGGTQFRGMGGLDLTWSSPEATRGYPEPSYSGQRPQPQSSQSFGARKGQPSRVLWVRYPPSVVIDEEMLHNAMILHGEIERITCFPDRHYSFVEFRSVDEARRAKEALQGRLFNDPRITIMFSSSDLAPGKDFGSPYPGFRGHGPDGFFSEVPFRPPLLDMFPPNHAMSPNSFHGPPSQSGLLGPGGPRQFGPRGSLDPLLPTPNFNDPNIHSTLSDLTANSPLHSRKRKLSSPAPAVTSRRSYKTSGWDVLDPNQLPRESKKSRVDGLTSFNNRIEKGDEPIVGVDEPYIAGPQFIGAADMGVAVGYVPQRADDDFIWRGVIAKGGTTVCHARCIPMGKGLEFEIPEVVNCSARTGLDMLAKHYVGAIGFDIVFFLPDSEDDFANYTEFLRYLGSKNRAGVAKLDNGTTLFLVPPSDFLTDVLKVAARERLYGVVLKLPQQLPGGSSTPQQLYQPLPPLSHSDGYIAPKKDLSPQMDYGSAPVDEPTLPPKSQFPSGSGSHSQVPSSGAPTSQSGVTLTPELLATLASLLPANVQTSVAQNSQPQFSSSTTGLPVPLSTNEQGTFSQGWSQHPHVLEQSGGQLYSNQQTTTAFQSFPPNFQEQNPVYNFQEQNPVYNFQEQATISSRPPSNIHPAIQSHQQFVPSTQGIQIQQYSSEVPHSNQNGYAMWHGTIDGSYGVPDIQQPRNPVSYSNEFHGANFSHAENSFPSSSGNTNMEPVNQAGRLQLQPVPSGSGQGSGEVEVDKNQKYQSTLQLAANLLLQIQQRQQQQQQHMGNQQ